MKKISLFFYKIFSVFLLSLAILVSWFEISYANDTDSGANLDNQIKASSMEKARKFVIEWNDVQPQETMNISIDVNNPMIGILTTIQKILLKLVLPIVAVGCGLYIAYELFTADGDESKMAMAWKAILYSVIAIICIGFSALIISVISRLNIG